MLVLPADFTPASLPHALSDGGGYSCMLRRLAVEDASLLLTFFHSHTAETRLRRYGFAKYEMSEAQASSMAGVDQTRNAALAIVEKTGRASRVVAVGRFTRDEPGANAEVAFVVHEKRRKQGMASILLKALFVIAAEQGIHLFHAQTQADNFPMLGIFLRAGAFVQPIPGTDSVEIQIPVPKIEVKGKKDKKRKRG